MNKENLSVIRQTFASAVFTHKVQEIAAENQAKNVFVVKVVNIILVFIVLILLIMQTAKPAVLLFSYLGAGITIAEVIFLIVQLTFSFEQRVVMHKNSALKYMGLRDAYRFLIADVMSESISDDHIITHRNLLQREYQVISDLAPQTGSKEYKEAQKRLNKRGEVQGEEFTWSDDEIDRFLPENLRLK